MSWDFIKRLRGATRMKVVVKGILTAEDAKLAVANGVDGLVVSNHGGGRADSRRAPVHLLPQGVDAVHGTILLPVGWRLCPATALPKAPAKGPDRARRGRAL